MDVIDAGRGALVFSLGGLSKSAGLPQVKLGWMAVGGPTALVDRALERLELVCDTYLSVSTPVQAAAPELIERAAPVRAQIQARIAANYRHLVEQTATVPACRVLHAEGGWYGVMQVPSLGSEEDLVVALVDRAGVLAHPGYFFDFPRGVVPGRQPASSRRRVRRRCRPRAAAHRIRNERPCVMRPADGEPACSSRCSPAPGPASWGIGDIGDIGPRRRGWRRPASARCSCCRSTRWRRASSRRTPRSARWRSIRSSSAFRPWRSFRAKRRSRVTIGRCSRACGSRR